ncbi:pre-mRNA-processing factor 39-2 isoform X2 [Lotus japonicus]|uniref:pre-mRNA-processing factor 39-2 isoform X2 n=1 Tax=Lotus japonicus TaxID=34305 RepID=UPI00258261DC|nr:pre-mRNA-processing factor 39-2 isoform X2 [Lotus japonicus]
MAALCPTLSFATDDNVELEDVVSKGSLAFDEWTILISEIDNTYPDNVEKICLVYDHFLSKFPLCYGYWRKYAAHMARLCPADKVVEVFEQAVLAATYSVGMWVDYCSFGMLAFEEPSDIRRLFKRAISFVGKDYLCHTLWDKYIQFEFSQQQWISLAHVYIQTLKFPTKKLHQYYDSFKKLATFLEEGMTSLDNSPKQLQSESCFDGEIPMTMCCKDDEIYCIIKDMMDSSVGMACSIAVKKYRVIGEQLYHNACELYSKISSFEANIERHYFHVQPLDAKQLQNWHDYLDFIELQGDFDWAVKLYERCLIVCANYCDYWMRYVDFMEAKGGREIANYSLDRATEIYLKGNMESAFNIYKEALEMAAAEEKLQALPLLYIHLSRLKYMSTNSEDASRDVLIDGIRTLPPNKLLLEELIKFSMVHGGTKHITLIDTIIADALSPRSDESQGLGTEDAEDISKLYLEFVDYCGTIHDVKKAWNRHMKLFPGSTRIDFRHQSAKCQGSLNLIQHKREEVLVALPNQASRDSSSDMHANLPQENRKVSSEYCDTQLDPTADELNHITQSNDTDMHGLQIMESDDKAGNNGRDLALPEEPRDNGPENKLPSADLVEVEEEPGLVDKNLKRNCSESDVSSENLLQQTASGNKSLKASSNENAVFSQCELETEELNPRESTCPDSELMTSQEECDTIPERSKLNSRTVAGGHTSNQDNSASTQDSESAQTHVEINNSYSACHQDERARRSLLPPRFSRNSDGKWHQKRNTGNFRRGHKYGHREYTHRKQHQQQQLPPQQFHPAGGGPQLPVTPGYAQSEMQAQQFNQGQTQFQATSTPADFVATHSWPIQNIPIQNSLSQSQSPANITSHVFQHPMQGNVQYGYMQNGQEHNQMWQQYYYQQQQQQLQLQQHYMQLQQQSTQQEQSQQLQQHGQLVQPQQLQQQPFQLEQSQQLQQHNQLVQPQQLQQQSFQLEQSQQLQQHSQLVQPQQLQQQSFQAEQSQQLQQQSQLVLPQRLQQQSFQVEQSQQQHSQLVQPQQLQQLLLQQQFLQQQQYFQQLQQQQQEHPVYLQQQQPSTQSNNSPVADQGQAIVTSQSNEEIMSQQSGEPGLVSSPVLDHPQED